MNSTIERMHARRTILDLCEAITLLLKTLLVMAQEHKETVTPAYTHHSQQAQPLRWATSTPAASRCSPVIWSACWRAMPV